MVGRQAEAISASGVRSALRKMRPRPVRTLVAVTKRRIRDSVSARKSMLSTRMSRSGLPPPKFMLYGEKIRAARSAATNSGE